jgi:UDP-MurNAc hydroxylase
MRFTTVGHACLFIEASDGTTLLVDPWLLGSCYWRSWWHFPPIRELRPEWLAPDYLYLTHYHFDHFHYPSVRKLSRKTRCVIPEFGIETMRLELQQLGFEHVEELPHGVSKTLGGGMRIASYQYGFDDTALAVAEGGDVLFDLNDCKIRGAPLQQLVEDFGAPTFMLRGHSFAMSYPLCYEAEDPRDLQLVTRSSYTDEFVDAARTVKPRYAIPYGSTMALLHPENVAHNDACVMPQEVADAMASAEGVDATELVVMAAGDRWDSSARRPRTSRSKTSSATCSTSWPPCRLFVRASSCVVRWSSRSDRIHFPIGSSTFAPGAYRAARPCPTTTRV